MNGAQADDSGRASIVQIAQDAGVSAATVSRVINGRPGVADKTRETIERLLVEYGYKKPLASTKTSRTVEFVISSLENNGSFELAKELVYQSRGFDVGIVITRMKDENDADECFRGIIDRNPLGVITLLSAMPDKCVRLLRSRGIPFVIINSYGHLDPNMLGIDIDNWRGGFNATQHLIDLGHTRIGVITGPANRQSSTARLSGYEAALRQAGIEPDPGLEICGSYTSDDSYRAANRLLELEQIPTAVFCFDDLMAVSLYKAAQEHGVSIPEDLSVIGFDDTYPAPYLSPSLTTIRQPFEMMAKKALRLVCDARDGEIEEPNVILPTQLVVRDSTTTPKVNR